MDLTMKEVAELLNVTEATVRRWISENKIPFYRLKNQYRFSRQEIERWVLTKKAETSPKKTAAKKKTGIQQYSLYRALSKGGIIYDLPCATKEELIRKAMKPISKLLNADPEGVGDLLLERENLQSTGLGNGIALPHTRDYLTTLHQDIVSVVFPNKPLPYDTLDGKPVHSLFFLFASDDRRHLQLLAKIAHFCSLPATVQFLKAHPTRDALLSYVKDWESHLAS